MVLTSQTVIAQWNFHSLPMLIKYSCNFFLEAAMPNPRSTAIIAAHPIHPMLIPFPIAFFVGTFVCDLIYWQTSSQAWAAATPWLLGAGLVMAALAAIMGVIDVFGDQQIRQLLAFSGWKGDDLVFRGRVGMAD
jgi:hypothetical protein